MSPDRVLVIADWVRWKHRFTLIVLSLIATTVASCVIGFWAVNETNTLRAERVERDTELQENFARENRELIIDGCERLEAFKAGMKTYLFDDLGASSPPEKVEPARAQYDVRFPPVDCTAIPADSDPEATTTTTEGTFP